MRRKIIVLFLLLQCNISIAQDVVTLKHTYYTSHFSKSKHIPVLIEYTLFSSMLQCEDNISRKGKKFAIDPELPEETDLQKDYLHSGYDRGHNMSAEDNKCNNIGMEECFYFSNMFPQIHSLNAGTWEELERKERKEANEYGSVKVFVGSLGKLCTIGEDNVVVPMYCWKIIYLQSTNEYECYIFPNEQPSDKNIEDYTTSLEIIEKKTGIYFKGEKAIIKGEN